LKSLSPQKILTATHAPPDGTEWWRRTASEAPAHHPEDQHGMSDPAASKAPEQAPEAKPESAAEPAGKPEEFGGPSGPEPTRYGDWERKGRCIDF
jgi:hypothetical protein